ncbi:DUF4326 domain-containing protein [Halobaculum sp. MBLA0143]|uniref:DUF4326 domain-containing protein n=1 Tax=Halobaculum sp. MBLA0143 TaxID=3079933 RepID=UPI0035246D28
MAYQSTLTGHEQTKLVNVSRHGRDGVRMIDRSTQFGNPFRLEKDGGDYTREGSVEAYREWFLGQVDDDPAFREAVEELRGETLGCWCKPKACHGDVILAYLRGELDVDDE